MDNSLLTKMPGYHQIEYTLIVNTQESMREKISRVRNEARLNYPDAVSINGKPHIRLARFINLEIMEEKLIGHLKTIAMGMPPFKVDLKDFGTLPSGQLFIKVATPGPFQVLMKELKSTRRLIKSPDREPWLAGEFYIPLLLKLQGIHLEKASHEYARRKFTGSFIADALLLLKRIPGEQSHQIAERLEFMNLPVNIKQGELFD